MADASAPAAPATPPAVELDEFGQQAKERLIAKIKELNALVTQFKASQGSEHELLEALRDSYTDNGGEVDKINEQITKLDKALDAAIVKRDELLAPIVQEQMKSRTNEGVDALTDKIAEVRKTVKAGENYLVGIYGEGAVADLPTVQRATTGGSGNAGSGGKRVRGFEVFVDGTRAEQKDAQGVMRSNLSAAARKLEVDPKVMQQAFWEAQGTQDSKQFKDSVTFTVTVNEVAHEVLAKRIAESE